MTNARIERLTREALGPRRQHTPRPRITETQTYTPLDDDMLRAVAIVVLMVVIIIFAAWPRDEAGAETHAAAAAHPIDARAVPASRTSDRDDAGAARRAENSPLY